MRADLALTDRGLCASRAQARNLIERGQVFVRSRGQLTVVQKPSQTIQAFQELIVQSAGPEFVSRGGHKLLGALNDTGWSPKGLKCVDFGQSTGGFTDCLLQAGALSVTGFDVGHDQLAMKLKSDPRVACFEGVNLKDCDPAPVLRSLADDRPDQVPWSFAVADLSFISLGRVLPNIRRFLKSEVRCLFLVKPQFEMGPAFLGKNGVIKDVETIREPLENNVRLALTQCGFEFLDFFPCQLKGGDGNQEFFVAAQTFEVEHRSE